MPRKSNSPSDYKRSTKKQSKAKKSGTHGTYTSKHIRAMEVVKTGKSSKFGGERHKQTYNSPR